MISATPTKVTVDEIFEDAGSVVGQSARTGNGDSRFEVGRIVLKGT